MPGKSVSIDCTSVFRIDSPIIINTSEHQRLKHLFCNNVDYSVCGTKQMPIVIYTCRKSEAEAFKFLDLSEEFIPPLPAPSHTMMMLLPPLSLYSRDNILSHSVVKIQLEF